jgi:hypothetical protein
MIEVEVGNAQHPRLIGRDAVFPSVATSNSARNPNALPVELLQQPQIFCIYNPTFRAMQKKRE